MLLEGMDSGTTQSVAVTLALRPLLSSVSEQGSQIALSPGQSCSGSQTYQSAPGEGLWGADRPCLQGGAKLEPGLKCGEHSLEQLWQKLLCGPFRPGSPPAQPEGWARGCPRTPLFPNSFSPVRLPAAISATNSATEAQKLFPARLSLLGLNCQ